jgi:hypothetical protein
MRRIIPLVLLAAVLAGWHDKAVAQWELLKARSGDTADGVFAAAIAGAAEGAAKLSGPISGCFRPTSPVPRSRLRRAPFIPG